MQWGWCAAVVVVVCVCSGASVHVMMGSRSRASTLVSVNNTNAAHRAHQTPIPHHPDVLTWSPPALIWIHDTLVATITGTLLVPVLLPIVALPSCDALFCPQHMALPAMATHMYALVFVQ